MEKERAHTSLVNPAVSASFILFIMESVK